MNIASLRSAPISGRRAPITRGPVSESSRNSGKRLGQLLDQHVVGCNEAEALDLEHHRHRSGDVDGVQAVDQGGDLQQADHREVAGSGAACPSRG